MQVIGKNIIGFDFSSESNEFFTTYDPKLQENTAFSIAESSENEIFRAVEKANNAFKLYRKVEFSERIRFLLLIAEKLEKNREFLIKVYQIESALPENRANVELDRTIFQLKHFANLLSQKDWDLLSKEEKDSARLPNPKPSLEKKLIPLGPVVVFGASNFPFAYSTIGGDSASALAAGCPVIVKSHYMHAGTADLVAQLVRDAAFETNMPDGVFSNLNSKGISLGQKLVIDPAVKAVGFTGSFKAGCALAKLISSRIEPIPFFAEMGSVNPIFIFESAYEMKDLPEKIGQSITLNAGQFCTNPGLIFLIESQETENFIYRLKTFLDQQEKQVMVHPNLFENYKNSCQIINNIIEKEKESILDFERPVFQVIDDDLFMSNPLFQEEVFGMHTILVKCKSISKFYEIIENLPGQLTGSIFSTEKELATEKELVMNLSYKVGRVIFNGVPTGVEVSESMQHGGPFPASTDSRFTAVGKDAIYRFLRPVCFQNFE